MDWTWENAQIGKTNNNNNNNKNRCYAQKPTIVHILKWKIVIWKI